MGADPNSRLLKLTTVVSSARDFSLSHERGLRYDEPPRLKTDPEGLVRYEFLSSLFVRSSAYDFESLSLAVCSDYDQRDCESFNRLNLRARNDQRQGRAWRLSRLKLSQ